MGINGCQDTFHDASASLILDGSIRGSLEEERFNRVKHSRGIPFLATQRLLRDHDIKPAELGGIGFYLDPWLLLRHYFLHPVREFYPDSLGLFQAFPFYLNFLRSAELLRSALEIPDSVPIFKVRHHLCHAAAAYYGSSFEQAAVLVVDGSGERETASYFLGKGTSLMPIGSPMRYPMSVGFFYEGIASHLGLGWVGGAGKLMGLAPYGKPTLYGRLRRWFEFRDDGSVRVDLSKMSYYLNRTFFTPAGLADIGHARTLEQSLTEEHANLAASAQRVLEDIVVHMARSLHRRTGLDTLCYSGGIALNIDANSAILEKSGFKNIYIMPAAYDGGTSIGAAQATYYQLYPSAPRTSALEKADLGTAYTTEAAAHTLTTLGIEYQYLEDDILIKHVATRLAEGAVVGWFRGRMEIGPRALGFRSILAHPGWRRMADYLNAKVKGRETFRPFAPAVPLEEAAKYFDVSAASPFMLYKFPVRQEYREALAAVTHVDGSARVQTVTQNENKEFHALLLCFGELTGIPVLLNTSFNLGGEPLVETPEQAIRSFQKGGMDILVMENLVVDNGGRPRFLSFSGLPPLSPGIINLGGSPVKTEAKSPSLRRFELKETKLEAWLRKSIERDSAEGFFRKYYLRRVLYMVNAIFSIANAIDSKVIRQIKA